MVGVRGVDGYSDDDVLSAAAAVEFDSEHPLGRAVVAAARELSLEFTSGSDFRAHNGIGGVAADVAGARVGVGGPGDAAIGRGPPRSRGPKSGSVTGRPSCM